ncbi:permease [Nocardia camponoti]|uniref:Permease n=1 Tax=Nocardia camponoti TaxID=1616106 RepID=A0A917QU77_9NOCA|nr:permease [Nocardia camponoti]GGK68269.1 hypothetical protein GCM10011591_45450 [Nocardia camponoti]
MTSGEVDSQKSSRAISWRNRAIIGGVIAVCAVIAYFILASFIPRWWAQRLGSLVHGSFTAGVWWGLVYGLLFTLGPLLLIVFAVRVWKRKGGRFMAGAAAIIAIVLALPNLMTLTIVLGSNSAAHAGEQVLNVDAPAFRGACAVGAIIGVLVFLALSALVGKRDLNRRKRAKAAATSADQPAETPPPTV